MDELIGLAISLLFALVCFLLYFFIYWRMGQMLEESKKQTELLEQIAKFTKPKDYKEPPMTMKGYRDILR